MNRVFGVFFLALIFAFSASLAHSTTVVLPTNNSDKGVNAYRVIKNGNTTYVVKKKVIDPNNPAATTNPQQQPAVNPQQPANGVPTASGGNCIVPPNVVGMHIETLKNIQMNNPVRILGPNTPATMDYLPERTNFLVNGQGMVYGVRCG